ncbi:kinase-like protein [Cryphonectria parasitica EP155]|uniref:non-specific serine/threonine protein kinase n=1 Tax=Cryphonectria parasitica (strain ATCC 38755 / EP155) TaxID=660469 RepID=A0A9P5CRH5_CRYP1|nr:kinase-like protein [Cryphonectria parasitica EP155]KAF3768574.1 kinase-like protein [Cryphonectria parasitica EP155]
MSSDSSSAEKYEVLEKIGHGSFGIIRKVRRKDDGMILCRKEISYLKMSQKEREQLHAEFTILSSLRHTNIVGYYSREHLKTTQDLHIYMEYCGNGDLGRVIRGLQEKNEYAEEAFVWSIFSQLVTALYRCHYGIDPPEVGKNVMGLGPTAKPKTPSGCMTILHRDLKPENIFLGEDNSVKLGDFGLSKVLTAQQFASTYVGTPFYMSPEICAAETYTLKSDVWSLGCIIYELCTRQPPFNAKSHYQLVQKIKEGKVAPLPNVYSSELSAVIGDCLRVNPDRRPDTATLLNLPVVRLMRKEREVVEMGHALQKREAAVLKREDSVSRRVRELEKRVQKLDADRITTRQEIDSSLRREWETRARLEIDRLVNLEIEQLQAKFEEEVQARVQVELNQHKKMVSFATAQPMDFNNSSSTKSDFPYSSIGADSNRSELTAATDVTELSTGPDTPEDEVKKGARTPFVRAQTMYAGPLGTPMDVDKMSPSPCAIASLSLSPRRKNAGKGPFVHPPNIFANDEWRRVPEIPDDFDSDLEEDESDETPASPSPMRKVKKVTGIARPGLAHMRTAPAENVLKNKPSLPAPTRTTGNLLHLTSGQEMRSPSILRERDTGNRQLSKIPSYANLSAASSGDSSGRGGLSRKTSLTGPSSNSSGLVSKMTNVRGRTLVELSQARAGGRLPGSNENSKAAVWDPETDEMPSPFLIRSKHIPKPIPSV